jgi:hypothetical protein
MSKGELLHMAGKYCIVRYDESFATMWDSFVDNSRNGTLLHKQKFLSYHPPERYPNHSLLFKKRDKVAAVFPAAEVVVGYRKVLYSHPGSSYGGFVVPFEFSLAEAFRFVDMIIEYAAKNSFGALEIRHSEWIFHKVPSEELDFALWQKGFRYSKRELSSAVALSLLKEKEIFDIFNYSAEKSVKKAMRAGLEFSISSSMADIETFHRWLLENLKERHQAAPVHTLDEIVKLKNLFPEEILLFGAYLKGRPLGFLMVLVSSPKAVHVLYTAQNFTHAVECRPINFIYYHLINWAKEHGFDYVNIGISTEEGGAKINWSLFDFKETLGGRGVRRDSYFLEL